MRLLRPWFWYFLVMAAFSPVSAAELSTPKPNAPRLAPASDEPFRSLKTFKLPPGFKADLFAAEPMFAHPVAFAVDEKNRVFVSESFRVGVQVTDIRRHMNWLDEELASTNTSTWRTIIDKYLKPDFMRAETERISLLEDTNGDGRADKATIFADGFSEPESGIAAGVLARKGEVWFTCIPDLWKLRDLNGDGKADQRESLHHGFAVRFGFYGHDLHGLRFGPDGRIYFSIGDRGFNVMNREGRRVAAPESGAVLRCYPDGSELEIFATGLRNPQELAFDQYGNLFTGDNNSDGGDQARWVYLMEGSDSGWRIGWQFINNPVSRGPWNAEKMWSPQNAEQPAHILPPLANLANGPSGLSFYPGLGLPDEYQNHFFLADFKGSPSASLVHSFALKPKGAGFEVVDRKPFISQILVTDVDFSTDGAVYVSDWVDGWGKTGKGRIYRVVHEMAIKDPRVAQTRDYLRQGFANKKAGELASLLSWPDQRVRQEAQFELASRGAASLSLFSRTARQSTNQLARIHALWGVGQLRATLEKDGQRKARALNRSLAETKKLLGDPDPEIQAQSAKVLGEAREESARSLLVRLVADSPSPRVQAFAAMALGKIGGKASGPALLGLLRRNNDQDPFLRHAAVMGLHWLSEPAILSDASRESSASVRLGALLAYRRRGSPEVAAFLEDADRRLQLEAARAVYDLTMDPVMPVLARSSRNATEPFLRRVVNARGRLGNSEGAKGVASIASQTTHPEKVRVEAVEILTEWARPSGRDRVTGLWRPIPERDGGIARNALMSILPGLLETGTSDLQVAAAKAASKHGLREMGTNLLQLALKEKAASKSRVAALQALSSWRDPGLSTLIDQLESSQDENVRREASGISAKLFPDTGATRLGRILESGTLNEKQGAFTALGALAHASANAILGQWLDRLAKDQVDPGARLELLEAAAQRKQGDLTAKLEQFDRSRPTNEIGRYLETLQGGNAAEGRKIFMEKAEASCLRCHKVGGEGGEAGPELDKGEIRSREHILESIVAPNKQIAPGFETVNISLKNGTSHIGIVKSENETELVMLTPEDGQVKLAKKEIDSRDKGISGMPDGLGDLLTKRELRDLVEFLATLRK